MCKTAIPVPLRYGAFLLLASLINIFDGMLVHSAAELQHRLVLALASSIDVVVVVTALYYLLLVRVRLRTKRSVITVGAISAMRASFLFPEAGVKTVVAGGCELAFIATALMSIRRARRSSETEDSDPVAAIRVAVEEILPAPVAVHALAGELAALYYALFAWRARPHAPVRAQAFTNYKRAGRADLLRVLPFACLLEIVPVHLLLAQWNAALAWVTTGLSTYALVWVVGLARAFPLRPTLVSHDYLHIRYGLAFQLKAPWERVACIRRSQSGDAAFAMPRNTEPSHLIEFVDNVSARGLFGVPRRLRRVALLMDDPAAFEQAIAKQFVDKLRLPQKFAS